MRVLAEFRPSESWLLQPGDALYLPPRYAHHGVSEHADCMTYSVGFRAVRVARRSNPAPACRRRRAGAARRARALCAARVF